jgi:hypothetical protein
LKHRLKEKFKDAHLDKPTSTDFSFMGGKRSKSVKKLRKTKDQSTRRSSDKHDEKDLK